KVKPPYNISAANQQLALDRLKHRKKHQQEVKKIIREKEKLIKSLSKCRVIDKVYPSDANFILVKVDDADKRYKQLIESGIVVRNRNRLVKDCLRITIGQ